MITIHNNEEPLYKLAKEIHDNAVSHGWWEEERGIYWRSSRYAIANCQRR